MSNSAWYFIGLDGKKKKMDDVRKKFSANAVIVLYACHSGLEEEFLQSIANLFNTKVIGFKKEIGYTPPVQISSSPTFLRAGTEVSIKGESTKYKDFHKLDSETAAITKKPPIVVTP